MNVRRTLVVDRAYERLDINGDGNITVQDVTSSYNPKCHPDVQNGRMNEQVASTEFVELLCGVRGSRHGMVSLDDFRNYYAEVSTTFDNDAAFIQVTDLPNPRRALAPSIPNPPLEKPTVLLTLTTRRRHLTRSPPPSLLYRWYALDGAALSLVVLTRA